MMLLVTVTLPVPGSVTLKACKSAALAIEDRVVLQRDVGQRQVAVPVGAGIKIKSAAQTVL